MFKKTGEIKVASKGGDSEDEILEIIDGGAEDVEEFNEDDKVKYLVYADPASYSHILDYLKQQGFIVESSELMMKPTMVTEVSDKDKVGQVLGFLERLEDHDDVQKVYANFDIDDTLIS